MPKQNEVNPQMSEGTCIAARWPTVVLLIEDNPGDIRLTQEAFRAINPSIHLHVARDGVEAISFLRHDGDHLHVPRPDLILLDLNLPKLHGREVLGQIKGDARLRTIPTLILTASHAPADIGKIYELQASCYLKKPEHWDGFEDLVRSLNDFWMTRVTFPERLA
jgi:two-component system, chemotaxis family, response regulator Rcp1